MENLNQCNRMLKFNIMDKLYWLAVSFAEVAHFQNETRWYTAGHFETLVSFQFLFFKTITRPLVCVTNEHC
jgi:uncharacterized DUF497 family protein